MAVLLRILRISGEEVLALTADEIDELWNTFGTTVKALKHLLLQLPSMQGLSHHRLRLVRDGEVMSDDLDWGANLGLGSLKLDLVVLDFVELTCDQSVHFAEAVQEGRDDEVEELLHMPADPNIDYVTAFNTPPLLWQAASRCLLETAGILLEARANVNEGDPFNCTPLCAAVTYHGDWDMIQLLIKADADILLGDDFGRTALWCAANHGRVRIAELLILLGADPRKAASASGQSPLAVACERQQWDFVKFLLLPQLSLQEAVDVNEADTSGNTPLWYAAQNGGFSIANLLLFAGADKDRGNSCGQTPLWIAETNWACSIPRPGRGT